MSAVSHSIGYSESVKFRRSVESYDPTIFTDIYREDTNIAIWRRQLSTNLQEGIQSFLNENTDFQFIATVTPESVSAGLNDSLLDSNYKSELIGNIAEIVEMFCYLFDLKRTGMRLRTLDKAMCPRFHIDRVPCRLVTTYHGIATEWLPHNVIDRSKLGAGNKGLSDEESGLFKDAADIKRVNTGDVALLKGELWQGNDNAGLVHRSPAIEKGDNRLLLTLDFAD